MAFSNLLRSNWKTVSTLQSAQFIAIGAVATVQMVSSVVHVWSCWKNGCRMKAKQRAVANSPYSKVVNGEIHGGWRMVLPRKFLIGDERNTRHKIIQMGWANDEGHRATLDWTILIRSTGPLPDGRKVTTFRRYSLLRSEIVATTLRVITDTKTWSHQYSCYLDGFTVVSIYRRQETTQYKLIISHAFRRLPPRVFALESPMADCDVHMVYRDNANGRICLVFLRWSERQAQDELGDEEATSLLEISIASYTLGLDTQLVYQPVSCHELSVPIGDRDVCMSIPTAGDTMTIFLYNDPDTNPMQSPLCITLGPTVAWRVESISRWLRRVKTEYGDTNMGVWKYVKMVSSFGRLNPTEGRCRMMNLRLLRYCWPVESRQMGAGVFAITEDGVFRRWSDSPPLKYVAAENLFRHNARMKSMSRSDLRKTVGFDVLEGIPERSDQEEEAPAIYLTRQN